MIRVEVKKSWLAYIWQCYHKGSLIPSHYHGTNFVPMQCWKEKIKNSVKEEINWEELVGTFYGKELPKKWNRVLDIKSNK